MAKKPQASLQGTDAPSEPVKPYGGSALPGDVRPGTDTIYTGKRSGARTTGGTDTFGSGSTGTLGLYEDPAYKFYGTMSEDMLNRYLRRIIEADNLSHMWWDGPGSQGIEYRHDYDPSVPATVSALYDPAYNHGKVLKMIVDTGAKMVIGFAGFRPGGSDDHPDWPDNYLKNWILKTVENDIRFIHGYDNHVICGAGVGETLDPKTTFLKLPPHDVIVKFYPHGRTSGDSMYFDYKLMLIDHTRADGWNRESHLDLTKPETLMYYYYLSTLYIDHGCESIHFGDLFYGCRNDTGNQNLWKLTKLIREYAVSHARRGLVLIDTHAKCDVTDPYSYKYLYGWYYDSDPAHPLPDWQRQLIFDFNMLGIYYRRNSARRCIDNYAGFDQTSILPVVLKDGYGLINHSKGGLHPMGWYCVHLSVVNRFDSGGIQENSGCSSPVPPNVPWEPDCYGYDNVSWLPRQTAAEQNRILIYTWYKIKCLDPYGYMGMPAVLPVRHHLATRDVEFQWLSLPSVNTTIGATIKNIWNGIFTGQNGWVHHNFTFENVGNPDIPPQSDPVFIGTDKIYFIGTDGYIHGYIKIKDNFNGGVWLTVSPSYAAQVPAGSQVKAKKNLVANPDGKTIIYIGEDNYIYGFLIADAWSYYYFSFLKEDMRRQGITAYGGLIYPTMTQVYYIAKGPDGRRVHGFINDGSDRWTTVSPSYSAAIRRTYAVNILDQKEAYISLVYHKTFPRDILYYCDAEGFVYLYYVDDLVTYMYGEFAGNSELVRCDLRIGSNIVISNNKMYFAGNWRPDLSQKWIYYFDLLGRISMYSPTWAAVAAGYAISSQYAADHYGQIAVSPNGNTIAYFGQHRPSYHTFICLLLFDGVNYRYQQAGGFSARPPGGQDLGRIQFTSNSALYFGSRLLGTMVHNIKYQENYCASTFIKEYEEP